MNVHCRCRKCEARQVKPKHPMQYKLGPICRQCGGRDTLRVDKWANERQWAKYVCRCDGYPYPHRIRWSRWCRHNPDHPDNVAQRVAEGQPEPQDFQELPDSESAPF